MPVTISPLTPKDIPNAVTCIQQAFTNDPYNNWVFSPETFSQARNSTSLSLRCKWGMSHALFHIAKEESSSPSLEEGEEREKVLGVACWLPPSPQNKPQTWSSYFGEWNLYLSQIFMNLYYGRGGLNVKRYYIWKRAQADAQLALWTDPQGYYFCNIVTVLPEWQGKGVGRALMGEVLERADREGRRCYLESGRAEPNLGIYRRLGFELVREMVCEDRQGEGIILYCMIREPRKV